jgi:hypothetical protein
MGLDDCIVGSLVVATYWLVAASTKVGDALADGWQYLFPLRTQASMQSPELSLWSSFVLDRPGDSS